ncbi:phosphoglycerate mutase family domain-containing protein [Nannizzia gypsea CBS 118893]|uniref:Phosphoglycerate mutase family domain-containing protein n=1 Tax=Arthroderma gypseum (strain ATCC MYA-4604 / CBS 118893) TaxID=535722 RepID=E5QZQ8_ARTGP|nr:phosphoglycerate mutase family domain-containing protein [Nannizzia gypsea CBS 118893]EFQ98209.1 phosphoglycerate mutase family domain-containing protein [Nannizzia gypsea CBS 118893]
MGKPRLIILIRHGQSEGNKNRDIHQTIPDHRIKLTPEGHRQALEAGRRLREMLRPDDKIHFFTSPYQRTRETTEGILKSLTSDDPSPSPFPRQGIQVYEEPRLREQDFGNFQPCSDEMERMWQERADYGHFFYRIPNGESAADAYDRVSGFNESLWRLFGDNDFASVCVLVTHGLMTRIFLMKWYHFSVEYFEDLRNINHCEFVVMQKNPDNGKYILRNKLRTWSELKKEREREREANNMPLMSPTSPRRIWGGCPDGCDHARHKHRVTKRSLNQSTSTTGLVTGVERTNSMGKEVELDDRYQNDEEDEEGENDEGDTALVDEPVLQIKSTVSLSQEVRRGKPPRTIDIPRLGGRDAGGSNSGVSTGQVSPLPDKLDGSAAPSNNGDGGVRQGSSLKHSHERNFDRDDDYPNEDEEDLEDERARLEEQSVQGSVY